MWHFSRPISFLRNTAIQGHVIKRWKSLIGEGCPLFSDNVVCFVSSTFRLGESERILSSGPRHPFSQYPRPEAAAFDIHPYRLILDDRWAGQKFELTFGLHFGLQCPSSGNLQKSCALNLTRVVQGHYNYYPTCHHRSKVNDKSTTDERSSFFISRCLRYICWIMEFIFQLTSFAAL